MASTYYQQIMAWNWEDIVRRATNDAIEHVASGGTSLCDEGCDDEGHIGYCYLGSVYALTPSGKFYMPWTTNQTPTDVDRDTRWYEALSKAAEKHGGYFSSGEGGDDLYFCIYATEAPCDDCGRVDGTHDPEVEH